MYPLPPLPYDADAVQPVIGAETMRTHHGKHHARYVRVVNDLLDGSAGLPPLEQVIAQAHESRDTKLFNNAAQAWNHAFFWECMTPAPTAPTASLQQVIEAQFGTLAALGDLFVKEGSTHFGSGWVWLVAANNQLRVVSTHDAEQPVGAAPLLVCDLWEHAYYLDYKNERDRFLRAWFDRLANWDFAAAQWAAAARGVAGYRYPSAAAPPGREAPSRHIALERRP